MQMRDANVFSTMAACFSPASREDWDEMISDRIWSEFIRDLRSLLQGDRLPGEGKSIALRQARPRSLQEFLADEEVSALFSPPSFDRASAFAARRFAGGVPDAAVPVESLYVEWTSDPNRGMFAGRTGLYLSDAALYMRDLTSVLGLSLPEAFAAMPDHVSIELDVVVYLLEAGRAHEAREFLVERFGWLSVYRLKLVELGEEALFHLALVDALLGIRAGVFQQAEISR